ncbi:MAG: RagB/SusD family nutrient uptake outer membrane protein [Paludibacteraceae bacterium]|nr:RagB/SusD family nutrient uptake outer membrane protein [Paludibacteraceae bacterium]
MKTIKIFFLGLALVLGLSACSDKFLDTELTGSSITQEELDGLGNTMIERVRGLYALMFQYGGDHQSFGQKSIDISTDILSGDVALTNPGYGYWSSYAARLAYTSGGYIWSHHYLIVANANNIVRYYNELDRADWTLTDSLCYAETLTLRAYSYFNLGHFFSPSPSNTDPQVYSSLITCEDATRRENPNAIVNRHDYYVTCPIYKGDSTEYNPENGLLYPKVLSGITDVYSFVLEDVDAAIEYFEYLETKAIKRESKLHVNKEVASIIGGYTALQLGRYHDNADYYELAYNYVAPILGGEFELLEYAKVLETGFHDVTDKSWIWGLDVTRENSTSLASFWGHMDIHTYSYAAAGGILGIDKKLYEEIPETDIRRQWFNATGDYNYCPQNKFYFGDRDTRHDPIATGTLNGVDRNWLSDIVYMRIEEAYLLAAEAAYRMGNNAEAKNVLSQLLVERDPTIASTLTDDNLLKQLYFNWRVELWGEGRGLLTFKRFGSDLPDKLRGGNHYYYPEKEMSYADPEVTFTLPSSEFAYNNALQPDSIAN